MSTVQIGGHGRLYFSRVFFSVVCLLLFSLGAFTLAVAQEDRDLYDVTVVLKEPPLPVTHRGVLAVRERTERGGSDSFAVDSIVRTSAERERDQEAFLAEFRQAAVGGRLKQFATGRRVEKGPSFKTMNAFVLRADRETIEELKLNDAVAGVYENVRLHTQLQQSIPHIRANYSWSLNVGGSNVTGRGQSVCVLDSGIATAHPAFAGRIVNQSCFCAQQDLGAGGCCPNLQTTDTSAEDDALTSHGTHVAGIVAANGAGLRGVAPEANIVAVKICDLNGDCTGNDLALGIDYCVSVASAWNVSAIQISLGTETVYTTQGSCPVSAIDTSINTAVSNGIFVSVSSGNEFSTTGISYPACSPNAVSVGAVSDSDVIPSFSNRGALLDLLAPGDDINSTLRNDGVGLKDGTSMSAPHVAGAALLLKQNEVLHGRTITPAQIRTVLKSTGVLVQSWSRLDVRNALVSLNTNLTINQSNRTVSRTSVGSVRFPAVSDLTGIESCLSIRTNNITVNSSSCPSFNASAELTLSGITFADAVPYRDGVLCTACNRTSYSGGVLSFTVPGFSSYTAGSSHALSIFDTSDTASVFMTRHIFFSANYTNSTGAANTTDGVCRIAFNTTGSYGVFSSMTFNVSSQLYSFNRSFAEPGNFTFLVNCSSNGEVLSTTDAFSVENDTAAPVVIIFSPENNTLVNITGTSGNVTFLFFVNDSTLLQNCSLFVNGSSINVSFGLQPGSNYSFRTVLMNATYNWSLSCSDAVNRTTVTGVYNLTLVNVNNFPLFSGTIPNQTFAEDTTVLINLSSYFADADLGDVLTYNFTGGDVNLSVTFNQTTGVALLTSAPNRTTMTNISFVATDNASAQASSNVVFVVITAVNDPPTLASTISDVSWVQDTTTTINLSAAFFDVDTTTAQLIFNVTNTSSLTVSINQTTGIATLSPPAGVTGTFFAVFNASDGEYVVMSNNVTLTVTAAPAPSSGSSGGGGGGGGGGSGGGGGGGGVSTSRKSVSCVPNWNCTLFSACVDGLMNRTCADLNACVPETVAANATTKPEETRTCVLEEDSLSLDTEVPLPLLDDSLSQEGLNVASGRFIWNTFADITVTHRHFVVVALFLSLMMTSSFVMHHHANKHSRVHQRKKRQKQNKK